MLDFDLIKNIKVDENVDWSDKVFLSFDVDWASDQVIEYSLDILSKYELPATFFITHATPLLADMRSNSLIELGIHPDFNSILDGTPAKGRCLLDVIEECMKIVPEAVSTRSHGMTQNGKIMSKSLAAGIKYDCNSFIPRHSNIKLCPWNHYLNLIKVPSFWEDDIASWYPFGWDVDLHCAYKGIKVFNFHPIHIFLNSKTLDAYNKAREHMDDIDELIKYRNTSEYGTCDFLMDIIKKGS